MLGHVDYPRKQRDALLDEFERSGLKSRPFAQVAGIRYPTFANWVQQPLAWVVEFWRIGLQAPNFAAMEWVC